MECGGGGGLSLSRVLLLVRDPRGTMSSRSEWGFCRRNPRDCYSAGALCRDLSDDYHAVEELSRRFPGRVRAIRCDFGCGVGWGGWGGKKRRICPFAQRNIWSFVDYF